MSKYMMDLEKKKVSLKKKIDKMDLKVFEPNRKHDEAWFKEWDQLQGLRNDLATVNSRIENYGKQVHLSEVTVKIPNI